MSLYSAATSGGDDISTSVKERTASEKIVEYRGCGGFSKCALLVPLERSFEPVDNLTVHRAAIARGFLFQTWRKASGSRVMIGRNSAFFGAI